ANGRTAIVFASEVSNYDLWSLPVDANRGIVKGDLQRLTDDPEQESRPSVSANGKKIAFQSQRLGNGEVTLKDLETGKETVLTSGPGNKHHPTISPDGAWVAYSVESNQR